MKKKLFLPFIFLFSIFSFPLSSQEVKFSGEAGTVWAAALRSEKQGDFVLGDTYLNAKLDAFYEKSSAYVEALTKFQTKPIVTCAKFGLTTRAIFGESASGGRKPRGAKRTEST